MPTRPEPSTSLAIIIVTYASSSLLVPMLSPLTGLENVRVVVVDNFSTAAEQMAVQSLGRQHGWETVLLSDNRGFGHGVNVGVARAQALRCENLLLLNPDVQLDRRIVEELHTAVQSDRLSLVAPVLTDPSGSVTARGSELVWADGRLRRRRPESDPATTEPWVTAACLALSITLFDQVGGFDESYFMYWEDVDFSLSCRRAGARLVIRDDLTAVHEQGGTQGTRRGRAKSSLYYYYNIRNRMVFAVKYLDRAALVRWLVLSPVLGWEVWLRGGRRQLIQAPTGAWAAVRGVLAGGVIGCRGLLSARPGPLHQPTEPAG